jgi:16S rRNA (guanine527-N7)-methyltransferase
MSPEPLAPPDDFLRAAAGLGVAFEPGDLDRLGRFLALLLDANRTVNLTAITDPREAWTKHILDAMTLLPLLAELPDRSRVIDVGSGGGVPGIPLAIVLPRLSFTLLEATGKKAAFLRRAVDALGLANVTVVNDRAENVGQDRGRPGPRGAPAPPPGGHRESDDAVIARAVGPVAVVAELCVPLCRVGGRVLLIKGQRAERELAEAEGALRRLLVVHEGTVDTPTGRIVVLTKRSRTPRVYPRPPGEPARAPLGRP